MNVEKEFYKNSYVPKRRCDVDLTLSENPFGCSDHVKKAIVEKINEIHRYPHDDKALVESIAQHHGVSVGNVLVGPGANQLLEDIFRVFALNKGVVGTSVTFPEPLGYIKTIGGFEKLVDLNADFTLNNDAILEAVDNEIGLVYVCNPNNPTGVYTSKQQMTSLVQASSVPVVISEVGADFVGDTLISGSCSDNAIIVRSFSKAYGLAGLRIGYIVANSQTISLIRLHQSAFRVNTFAITAALAAIQDQGHLHYSVSAILAEKENLIEQMSQLGFEVVNSQGQTFIAKVPKIFLNATDFCNRLNKYGVAVVNCSVYKGLEKYIRIAPQKRVINDQFILILKEMFKEENHVSSI